MYMVRPALRAASTRRAPARIIHRRRYPSASRIRSLHSTRRLAQASDPPSNPDNTPVSEDGTGNTSRGKAAAGEQPDAASAAEDPESLAQKLQRSRELTRRYSSALRRSQRRNRNQNLPPVHIPDWFLKQRVIHSRDLSTHRQERRYLALSLSHKATGEHATCPIPAPSYPSSAKNLSRLTLAMWKRKLGDQQRKELARKFAAKVGSEENATSTDRSASVQDARHLKPRESDTADSAHSNSDTLELNVDRIAVNDIERTYKLEKLLDKQGNERTENTSPNELNTNVLSYKRGNRNLSSLVLAEIRTTMAASLASIRPSTDSFPSTKSNLILHSPLSQHEQRIDEFILESAAELGSDVLVLEAQDLAQIAGDYLGEPTEPTPHSIRSLGYETYRLDSELEQATEELEKDEEDEQETDSQSPFEVSPSKPFSSPKQQSPANSIALAVFRSLRPDFSIQIPTTTQGVSSSSPSNEQQNRPQTQNEIQLEDLKISALLDVLIDAHETTKVRKMPATASSQSSRSPTKEIKPIKKSNNFDTFFDYTTVPEGSETNLGPVLAPRADSAINLSANVAQSSMSPKAYHKSKIIHVKDFKELSATYYGSRIIEKLEEIVRRRRKDGESIMIVGSTCSDDLTPEFSAGAVQGLQSRKDSSFFRTIVVAPEPELSDVRTKDVEIERISALVSTSEKRKFATINFSHILDMLRCLDPVSAVNIAEREKSLKDFDAFRSILPDHFSHKVLSYDEVHRISLMALGLHTMSPSSRHLNWAHVAFAMGLIKASDEIKFTYFKRLAELPNPRRPETMHTQKSPDQPSGRRSPAGKSNSENSRQGEIERVAATATKHEKRLMPGIANPDQIKTTFDQVHVPKETVDSIRTLTSLSLLRPDAFNYGVLATEKISGALLYGPPGTGKTLLAKAVAKESGSTVLEVSGSQIMDKYVGEGEKNVAAVFSLARKLSPCIVFLDEADAIFSTRDAGRERASHREILNQFLKEWDGLNDLSVFVMVATNRPFDLDDAVIRRLPRRLLVDLPTEADRLEILKIHLRGEQLDDSVSLHDVAKRTPLYSGSDLKNLVVSAALACVKEENEQAAIAAAKAAVQTENIPSSSNSTPSQPEGQQQSQATSSPQTAALHHLKREQHYVFPEKRTLHNRHFDKAMQEISASISENMSSLNAIKKFDEQYGSSRGRKKKNPYGFGIGKERSDDVARVRS